MAERLACAIAPFTHFVPVATGRIRALPPAQMPYIFPSAEQTRAPGAPQPLPPVAGCGAGAAAADGTAAGAAAPDGDAEDGTEGAAAGTDGAPPWLLPPAGREMVGIPAPPAGEGLAAAPPLIEPEPAEPEPVEPEPAEPEPAEPEPAEPEPAEPEPEPEPDEADEADAQEPCSNDSQHYRFQNILARHESLRRETGIRKGKKKLEKYLPLVVPNQRVFLS